MRGASNEATPSSSIFHRLIVIMVALLSRMEDAEVWMGEALLPQPNEYALAVSILDSSIEAPNF